MLIGPELSPESAPVRLAGGNQPVAGNAALLGAGENDDVAFAARLAAS